jgi:hypothetical protein
MGPLRVPAFLAEPACGCRATLDELMPSQGHRGPVPRLRQGPPGPESRTAGCRTEGPTPTQPSGGPGGCPPWDPTDPDVPNSGIRLLRSRVSLRTGGIGGRSSCPFWDMYAPHTCGSVRSGLRTVEQALQVLLQVLLVLLRDLPVHAAGVQPIFLWTRSVARPRLRASKSPQRWSSPATAAIVGVEERHPTASRKQNAYGQAYRTGRALHVRIGQLTWQDSHLLARPSQTRGGSCARYGFLTWSRRCSTT